MYVAMYWLINLSHLTRPFECVGAQLPIMRITLACDWSIPCVIVDYVCLTASSRIWQPTNPQIPGPKLTQFYKEMAETKG